MIHLDFKNCKGTYKKGKKGKERKREENKITLFYSFSK